MVVDLSGPSTIGGRSEWTPSQKVAALRSETIPMVDVRRGPPAKGGCSQAWAGVNSPLKVDAWSGPPAKGGRSQAKDGVQHLLKVVAIFGYISTWLSSLISIRLTFS